MRYSQGFDASKYASKTMSVDTVNKMKEVFDLFDYDHSGQISVEEILNTVTALNMEDQAANIISTVQANTDAEELDFATFLGIFGQSEEPSETSLQALYEIFDPNGTRSFGPEDFERVCDLVGERFSPAEVDQMIDYADKDRDGGISFEEFVAVVTREYKKL